MWAEGDALIKNIVRLIFCSIALGLAATAVWADPGSQGRMPILRDATYERDLQWEASADKAITPAKVIRCIMGMSGRALAAPSPIEFQPIFRTHDGQSVYVATIAYKF
jgi:hypothetical protein